MSNWKETLNERLQKERQAIYESEMRARRERESAPKPYKDPRSEKDRERELKNIIEQLGFKVMLEDVKRNIWEGRGKISSSFFPDNVSYKLHQQYYYSRTHEDMEDHALETHRYSNNSALRLGAQRQEGETFLYLSVLAGTIVEHPQIGSCEFPYNQSGAVESIQQALINAAYNHK